MCLSKARLNTYPVTARSRTAPRDFLSLLFSLVEIKTDLLSPDLLLFVRAMVAQGGDANLLLLLPSRSGSGGSSIIWHPHLSAIQEQRHWHPDAQQLGHELRIV